MERLLPRTFEALKYTVVDWIATIKLSRPERRNAFTPAMADELVAAFDAADADDDVRAIVLTGEGGAFCAGADLANGGETFDYERRYGTPGGEVRRDNGGRVTLRMFRCLKPLIAAVNGPAVGIGATMLLAADIRFASTEARFGFVFARRGITMEAASSWFLPHLVGISTALEWAMSGRLFDAQEALARGLVRSVHQPDRLLPAAEGLAREIADHAAPVSVAMMRQMIWRMAGAPHPMDAHRFDSRALQSRGRSADAREGIASFLEKRSAHFAERVTADMPDWFDWQGEPAFE